MYVMYVGCIIILLFKLVFIWYDVFIQYPFTIIWYIIYVCSYISMYTRRIIRYIYTYIFPNIWCIICNIHICMQVYVWRHRSVHLQRLHVCPCSFIASDDSLYSRPAFERRPGQHWRFQKAWNMEFSKLVTETVQSSWFPIQFPRKVCCELSVAQVPVYRPTKRTSDWQERMMRMSRPNLSLLWHLKVFVGSTLFAAMCCEWRQLRWCPLCNCHNR